MGALPALIDALRLARDSDVEIYRRDLRERGIGCATVSEPGYPQRLSELHDPPLALFWMGGREDTLAWPGAGRRHRRVAQVAPMRLRDWRSGSRPALRPPAGWW